MNYQENTQQLADKLRLKLTVISSEYRPYFPSDKESRYVFKLKLSKGGKHYTFEFGQSINSGNEEPIMYNVLTCLQKYDVGSFEEFCSEFGYDTDSMTANRTYKAVCKEFKAVERLFNSEEIELLQELQ